MKTKNIIIGLALAGAGAYYAFKKGLFGKKVVSNSDIKTAQDDADLANQLLAEANRAKASTISIQNPTSYKAKVAKIQLFLGVASDGIFGNQTLLAVRNKFPQLAEITLADWQDESNIDILYSYLKSKGLI